MSTTPFDLVNSKLATFKQLVVTHPQLQPLFTKFGPFWTKFGKVVTYSALILTFLVIAAVGVNLGLNYARQIADTTNTPLPINTPTVTKTQNFRSVLLDVRDQVQAFDPLLPDPAPPAVDNNITLKQKP